MLDRYDVFRHGYLSFDEFCIMMGPASVEGNEMHATFDALDLNHTGKLTASELKEVLVKIGGITSEEELRAMLHLADPSNSGVIDYNAFADMINRFDAPQSPSSLRNRSFPDIEESHPGFYRDNVMQRRASLLQIPVSTETRKRNLSLPCRKSLFCSGDTRKHNHSLLCCTRPQAGEHVGARRAAGALIAYRLLPTIKTNSSTTGILQSHLVPVLLQCLLPVAS
jgi:hypothetical protein